MRVDWLALSDAQVDTQMRRSKYSCKGDCEKDLFASQPQHTYVTGEDCAIVPVNTVRKPACGCGNKHGAAYKPGLHATWDCPHRYIAKYGRCPGFLANGFRDPTQWNGNSLTRAAKAAWVTLIQAEDLPLPHGGSSRAPPFHL